MSIETNPHQEQYPQTLPREVLMEESQRLIGKVNDAFTITPGIQRASFEFSPLDNEYWSLTLINNNRFHIEKRAPMFRDGKPVSHSALALDISVYEGGISVWDMTKKYGDGKNTKVELELAESVIDKIISLKNHTSATLEELADH